MARFPFISAILLLLCSAAAADGESSFLVSNHIRMVSDSLREKEASVLEVIGNTHHALSFARFAHRFGKKYEGDNEMKLRFAIFSENLDLIRATNRKRLPYKLAVNKFADLTWEEFRSHRLGAAQNCSATLKGNHKLTDAILPEKKDWREEGIVSPVKDQGDCGSCWTFSSTGALEAAYKQAFGKGISLSEQQLVDCAGAFDNFGCNGGLPSHAFEYIKYNGGIETETAYPYTGKDGSTGALEAAYKQAFGKGISLSEQQLVDCAGAFDNFGCNGGLPSHAFEYIKYNGGIETETAYPYTGKDGICKFSSENVAVQVLSSVNITLGAEDELKHAVGLVRPVSVAFQANREFSFYGGGVFTSKTCGSTPMDVNHAVVAVGYGVEDGVPYWLIKNSWGAEWGDNGYFKMEMGKNMCGVATCASYPIIV